MASKATPKGKAKSAKKAPAKPKAKAKEEVKPQGRPTLYTPELAKHICVLLSQGISLRKICASDENLPHESTVRTWAVDNLNGFYTQYTRARDMGLDAMADEILDISDTPKMGSVTTNKIGGTETKTGDMIEHRRLQVDTRKWYLSKMAPKRYDRPTGEDKPSGEEIAGDYVLAPDEDLPDAPIL